MTNHSTTTVPLAAALAADTDNIRPEWVRLPVACRVSGCGRSFLYPHLLDGTIKSVCLRNKGAKKGIRLVHLDSLMAFIERHATTATAA